MSLLLHRPSTKQLDQSIVMYTGLYRADQSKARYKPESSTQKGRVNPPP